MKQRLTLLTTMCLLTLSSLWAVTSTKPTAGDGSEDSPYEIATLDNYYWLTMNSTEWDKHYVQTADIDATNTNLPTIGNSTTAFTGSYSGSTYSISNLTINRSSFTCQAMFAYTNGATIDSIALEDASILAKSYVAGIVASSISSTISACTVSGNITATEDHAAGIVAKTQGTSAINDTISLCVNKATVTSGTDKVGGIAAEAKYAYISQCMNMGAVTCNRGSGAANAGGILGTTGENSIVTTVIDCYNTGAVTASSANSTGGILGSAKGNTMTNCYSTGIITSASQAGGLAGWCSRYNNFANCYTTQSPALAEIESGQTIPQPNVEVLSVQVIQQESNFANWDFTTIWQIDEGKSTPSLRGLYGADAFLQILPFASTECRPNQEYRDTVRVFPAADVVVALLQSPTGMTIVEDSILVWTPTASAEVNTTVEIEATAGGMTTTYNVILNCIPFSGQGTAEAPYEVATLAHLQAISASLYFSDKHFVQTANINAAPTEDTNGGAGFQPIKDFSGSYNGKHYTIDSLHINIIYAIENMKIGLFANANNATLDSIALVDNDFFISTYNDKTIYAGALLGAGSANINACYSTGSINMKPYGMIYTGGLIGEMNAGSLNNSSARGKVIVNTTSIHELSVGGLMGKVYTTGDISISNSYSTATVDVTAEGKCKVGGLIGNYEFDVALSISQCYASGSVRCTAASNTIYLGGLVGYTGRRSGSKYLTIEDSYSIANIFGENSGLQNVGGLIGYANCYIIHRSYASAKIETETLSLNSNVGEFIGSNFNGSYENNYCNSDINSGLPTIGNSINTNTATPLTSTQMQQEANFSGFDFENVWVIAAGQTYPVLRTVSNNAPFAMSDSLDTKTSGAFLANDYDYETTQTALCYKVVVAPTVGSVTAGEYSFGSEQAVNATDSLCYMIGELIAVGDTLWGNATMAYFINGDTPTGTDFVNSTSIELYPNPAHSVVTINAPVGEVASIFTLSGKMVSSTTITEAKQQVNTSNLSAGVYLVKVNTAVSRLVIK